MKLPGLYMIGLIPNIVNDFWWGIWRAVNSKSELKICNYKFFVSVLNFLASIEVPHSNIKRAWISN